MSPDNIAPVALYLASERSDWLTGRVVSAMGFEVGLYENPQQIRQFSRPAARGSTTSSRPHGAQLPPGRQTACRERVPAPLTGAARAGARGRRRARQPGHARRQRARPVTESILSLPTARQ